MRTTLDIDDELVRRATKRAAQLGTTLTAVVEAALVVALAPWEEPDSKYRLDWQPNRGRYIGGVDLANPDALEQVMEADG